MSLDPSESKCFGRQGKVNEKGEQIVLRKGVWNALQSET